MLCGQLLFEVFIVSNRRTLSSRLHLGCRGLGRTLLDARLNCERLILKLMILLRVTLVMVPWGRILYVMMSSRYPSCALVLKKPLILYVMVIFFGPNEFLLKFFVLHGGRD